MLIGAGMTPDTEFFFHQQQRLLALPGDLEKFLGHLLTRFGRGMPGLPGRAPILPFTASPMHSFPPDGETLQVPASPAQKI